MQQYNIHKAKTTAKASKPVVKVVSCSFKEPKKQRIGFLKGKIFVPADFDSMGEK